MIASAPARADCTQNGTTVTCAPPGTGGFVAATSVNNLTVTVQPGTTVVDDGAQAISLNDNNTVTNNGTVNAATDVVFPNSVVGIVTGNDNTVTNNGTINASGSQTQGIVANGTGNTVINSASGTIMVTGASTTGIASAGGNILTNNGTIIVSGFSDPSGALAVGISSGPNNSGQNDLITNSGTIWVNSADAVGILGNNGQPTIKNLGTINVTNSGVGISANPDVTLQNSGSINATGAGSIGVSFDSNGNGTFTNSGSIIASGTNAEALHIRGLGSFSSIGITNNGTLQATGIGSYALRSASVFGGAPSGATVTNNGTIDGRIDLSAGNDVLTNSGLITVTSSNIPIGTVFSIADGDFVQTAAGTLSLRVTSASGTKDAFSIANGSATLAGTLKAVVQSGLYANSTTYSGVVTTCGLCGGVSGTFGT